MRIIPKKIKVKNTVWKCYSMPDVIVALVMFALIGFIVWRGFRIAARCGNFYGYLLAGGITLAFAVQSALNALVVSGCIPPTGLPLPLVSAGNTSLIVTLAGMGVVYGVSRHTQTKKLIQCTV